MQLLGETSYMMINTNHRRTILSQPPTPSPSLYPLLQLGDLEDTAPGDKVRSVSME